MIGMNHMNHANQAPDMNSAIDLLFLECAAFDAAGALLMVEAYLSGSGRKPRPAPARRGM